MVVIEMKQWALDRLRKLAEHDWLAAIVIASVEGEK